MCFMQHASLNVVCVQNAVFEKKLSSFVFVFACILCLHIQKILSNLRVANHFDKFSMAYMSLCNI